jgi:hypothetical protein
LGLAPSSLGLSPPLAPPPVLAQAVLVKHDRCRFREGGSFALPFYRQQGRNKKPRASGALPWDR